MLAISDSLRTRAAKLGPLVIVAAIVSGCAPKQQVALVDDPAVTGRESALPWNEQQKWEGQGQFGGMAERMNAGSGRR